ncbi:ATP-binding protein [Thalassotalea sp. ND16A]|uniref:ATP-binding protein n=1 Tax=Thalassotalea sp. ND16A TaxID=1535422 RepID=UPI00051A6523|nr:ATP-binding protein [Thalassotalea sp. ND16A]KGJ98052.1 hypothetical protein ND16A_0857 [Thalassotalea sp. ND16A]
MIFQFARLYVLIVLLAFLIIYLFGQIYNNLMKPPESYSLDVQQIFAHVGEPSNPQIQLKQVARNTIAMPARLESMLEQGEVIEIADEQGFVYFYQLLGPKTLYQMGPISLGDDNGQNDDFYFVILFYSALGLLVLGFIWPLFKDLAKLQQQAIAFGEQPNSIDSEISPSSNIYPLARAFEKMSHQIVNTMQMHQDLSRTIAHEIRTPLARMKFLAEIIAPMIEKTQQQRLLADIGEIQQMMDEYLSFERLEHKHYLMAKEKVNVEQFFSEMSAKLDYYPSRIQVNLQSTVKQAYFNEQAMNRALQNLINNALRYANNRVDVCFSIVNNICILEVSDDGPGVGQEAKKLIQPFVRKESQGDCKTGYGLGLYIVRKILIWHQGELELDNSPSLKGAKVTLSWPNIP